VSRPRLLLVDDDSRAGELAEQLRAAGLDVELRSGAADALDRARGEPPDVVVGREKPDGPAGLELLHGLRSAPSTAAIPFFLLARDPPADLRERALAEGAVDCLADSLDASALAARATAALPSPEAASGDLAGDGLVRALCAQDSLATFAFQCSSPDGEGTVWVARGRILDAKAGTRSGEAALRRLLSWTRGEWKRSEAGAPSESIARPVAELLPGLVPPVQELRRLRSRLPSLDLVPELDFLALAAHLDQVPDTANAVLRLADGSRSVRNILDEAPCDDAQALAAVVLLLGEGIARVRSEPGQTPPALATPAPEPISPVVSAPSTLPTAAAAAPEIAAPAQGGAAEAAAAKPMDARAESVAKAAESDAKPAAGPKAGDEALAEAYEVLQKALETPAAPEPSLASVLGEAAAQATPAAEAGPGLARPEGSGVRGSLRTEQTRGAVGADTAAAPAAEPAAAPLAAPSVAPAPGPSADSGAPPAPSAVAEAPIALSDGRSATAPEAAASADAAGGGAFASLLAADGPTAPATQDRSAVIPVVRFPGRRSSRSRAEHGAGPRSHGAAAADRLQTGPRSVLEDEDDLPHAEKASRAPVIALALVLVAVVAAGIYVLRGLPQPGIDAPVPALVPPLVEPMPAPAPPVVPVMAPGLPPEAQTAEAEPAAVPPSAVEPPAPAPAIVPPPAEPESKSAPRSARVAERPERRPERAAERPAPAEKPAPKPVEAAPVARKPVEAAAPAPKPEPPVVKPAEAPAPAPGPSAAQLAEYDRLFAAGRAAVAAENFKSAVDLLNRALKIRREAPALRELGKAMYGRTAFPAALKALREAVSLDAADADAWLNLGMIYQEMNNAPDACGAYKRVRQIEPGSERSRELDSVLKNLGC